METPALHPVLAAAVAAAGPRAAPYRARMDGPPAAVAPAALARLGVWCAEYVEAGVEPAARPEFTGSLEEARGYLADRESVRAYPWSQGNARFKAEHLSVARLAAAAARRAVRNPAATRVALCAAVKIVVRLERAAARRDRALGEARVQRFLEALDEELLRLEAASAVEERAQAEGEVEAVLWRKAEGDRVVFWLVRLAGPEPRYGLLGKLGGRWRWTEGPRDDALSSVPDALFPEAVERALARDGATSAPARGR